MMPLKLLFVCTANIDRSPTAEGLFRGKDGFEVLSAGTWVHAHTRISKRLVKWADKIFVMEAHHKEAIINLAPKAERKIILLDIPDIYKRNDSELVRTLKAKLSKHLDIHL